jgi:cytochrome c-type biogenesis protein CcmH
LPVARRDDEEWQVPRDEEQRSQRQNEPAEFSNYLRDRTLMVLYGLLGTMLLAAVLVIAVPLYRKEQRVSTNSSLAIAVVLLLSASVYKQIGTPDSESQEPGAIPGIEEMVDALAERLQRNPNDLPGWKMLGRSYVQMQNFAGAIDAFEKAVAIEGGQDGQTLADLGEVVLIGDRQTMNGRAGELFENALAVAPNNQKALFYAGLAAVERGDKDLAVQRWETLLASSPPPNIQEILRQQIAELRGEAPMPAEVPGSAEAPGDAVVAIRVSLGESAISEVQAGTTVFIIVRDPAQPSPPIAAVRRQTDELPAYVAIGDSDAMVPGRVPSGFAQLEIVARVSMSGQPSAQSGDWFGQQTISTAESSEISVIIDEQVP